MVLEAFRDLSFFQCQLYLTIDNYFIVGNHLKSTALELF